MLTTYQQDPSCVVCRVKSSLLELRGVNFHIPTSTCYSCLNKSRAVSLVVAKGENDSQSLECRLLNLLRRIPEAKHVFDSQGKEDVISSLEITLRSYNILT